MPFFDKVKDSIYEAGQEVSMRAKNASESARINNLIKNNEQMIQKLTYQVGNQCVNAHLHEENTEYEEIFAEIRRLQDENESYQNELAEETAVKTCPQCGAANKSTANFCIHCGAPLSGATPQPAQTQAKTCPNCGTVNDPDASFCVECGTPLPEAQPEPAQEPETAESSTFAEGSASEGEPETVFAEETETVFTEEPEPETAGQPTAGKVCQNCGAVNDEDAVFCVECGALLPMAEAAPEAEPEPEPEEEPIPEPEDEEELIPEPEEEPIPEPEDEEELIPEPEDEEELIPEPEDEEELIPEPEDEEELIPEPEDEEELIPEPEEEPIPEPEEEPVPEPEAEPAAGKVCPNCGYVNAWDSLYCIECGQKLPEPEVQTNGPVAYCKNCGAPLPDDVIFCTNCGTRRD